MKGVSALLPFTLNYVYELPVLDGNNILGRF